jgi:Na+/H+-dicarboxylate symporter
VPRASLVIIAGMLSYFKIPVEGLLLLLAIDQLLDMGRSATNVIGNAVACAVIDKSEKIKK